MAQATNMTCKGCGAQLAASAGDIMVKCEYCGVQNAVPSDLADLLSQPKAGPAAGEVQFSPRQWTAPVPAPPDPQADARMAAAAAQAAADAAARQITAGAARAGKTAANKLVGCAVAMGVLVMGVTGAVVFMVQAPSEGPLKLPGLESVMPTPVLGDDMVTPSWKAADGLAFAMSVETGLRARWRPSATCESVQFMEVKPDGTIDLTSEGGLVAMSCYDTSQFEGLAPGLSTVEKSRYMVSASREHVGGIETDTSASSIEGFTYATFWPKCGLAAVRAKAAAAGWPADGFATISWPSIPYQLTRDRLKVEFVFIRPDGDKLEALLEAEGWDTEPYKYYGYYVPNWDGSKLPQYFSPEDCEPVDVEALQKKAIEGLRDRCEECKKPPSSKKKGKKKASAGG